MIKVKSFLFTLALLCLVKQSHSMAEEEFKVSIVYQQDHFVNPWRTCIIEIEISKLNTFSAPPRILLCDKTLVLVI